MERTTYRKLREEIIRRESGKGLYLLAILALLLLSLSSAGIAWSWLDFSSLNIFLLISLSTSFVSLMILLFVYLFNKYKRVLPRNWSMIARFLKMLAWGIFLVGSIVYMVGWQFPYEGYLPWVSFGNGIGIISLILSAPLFLWSLYCFFWRRENQRNIKMEELEEEYEEEYEKENKSHFEEENSSLTAKTKENPDQIIEASFVVKDDEDK